jgi:hypothetical protein
MLSKFHDIIIAGADPAGLFTAIQAAPECKIRCKSATHSGAFRPPIPEHSGHLFRSIPATYSGAFRPPIPEHSGHPFRSIPATYDWVWVPEMTE